MIIVSPDEVVFQGVVDRGITEKYAECIDDDQKQDQRPHQRSEGVQNGKHEHPQRPNETQNFDHAYGACQSSNLHDPQQTKTTAR